jgi:hypothetical protein
MDEKLKLAFFIGINDYKLPGANLSGCVNDVERNAKFFIGNGFHVVHLFNKDASRKNILKHFESLVHMKPDVFVFNYSGHGSYIDDTSSDEIDGRDEVLCCHDFNFDGGYIVDDELHQIFSELPAHTRKLTLFDCCHSGTQMRSFVHEKVNRQLPPIKNREAGNHLSFRTIGSKLENLVCYSACLDCETAAEILGDDGTRCGAFSQALAKVIMDDSTLTFTEIRNRVKAKLRATGISQTPSLSVSASELLDEKLSWIIE